jgi:uncharacterized membrane protein YeiB
VIVMAEAVTKTVGQAVAAPAKAPAKTRLVGVDVTRGVALLGMFLANISAVLNDNGTPTIAALTVTGRAATLFAMVAGISLALITGGRSPVQGRARRGARAAIAVRGLLIGVIGLTLAYFVAAEPAVILTYYGLSFLLAIPLIGLRPRTLACIAGALIVIGPLLLLGAYSIGLQPAFSSNPTLTAPFTNPAGFLVMLLLTGDFPVVVFMIYIITGLAIGRLDLTSTKVAVRLLAGGAALAVAAWEASWVLLFPLGGISHLHAAADPGLPPGQVVNSIVWDGNPVSSWWWLALRAHDTGTPFDALLTLGVAMAVLGGMLLLTKLSIARRLLRPLALAGTMTLTIYSAHLVILNTNFLSDTDLALYLVLVAGALTFAVIWHRLMGQGPLERVVAMAAGRARRAVMARGARGTPGSCPLPADHEKPQRRGD